MMMTLVEGFDSSISLTKAKKEFEIHETEILLLFNFVLFRLNFDSFLSNQTRCFCQCFSVVAWLYVV